MPGPGAAFHYNYIDDPLWFFAGAVLVLLPWWLLGKILGI